MDNIQDNQLVIVDIPQKLTSVNWLTGFLVFMWMIQAYSNLELHPKLEKKHDKLPNNVQLRILTHEKMQEQKHYSPCKNLKLDQCKLQEAIFPNQPTNL